MQKKLLMMLLFIVIGAILYKLTFLPEPVKIVKDAEVKQEQGVIKIRNLGYEQQAVPGSTFGLYLADSNEFIETIKTNQYGQAVSSPIKLGENVRIEQIGVNSPYQIKNDFIEMTVSQEVVEVEVTNRLMEHIKEVEITGDGEVRPKKVYLDVATLLQKPELPNGCEIVSLTALLHYYGYSVSKEQMSDDFLPKEAFFRKDGRLIGPDPHLSYAGNPRNETGAFFSYADPIVIAGNSYLSSQSDARQVLDVTGSSKQQILELVTKGHPVVVWTTLDLSPPKITAGWYLSSSGKYFKAPVNLHVVVINGYEDGLIHVMNPLKGQVTYDSDKFFTSYEEMERRALIIQ